MIPDGFLFNIILVFFAIDATVLLLLGLRSGRKSLTRLGGGLLAICAIAFLLNFFIETSKQQVAKRTRQLVTFVVASDTHGVRSLLDDKANAYKLDADGIAHHATDAATASLVKDVTITSLKVTQDASGIISKFDCIAQFKPESSVPYSVPTSWELHWLKTPDHGWLVYELKCTRMGNQDASQVIDYIVNR